MNPRAGSFNIIFSLLGSLVLVFLVAPVAGMVLHTSMPELASAFGDAEVRASIRLTLLASLAGTLALSVFAIPLAYLLARKNFPLKSLVIGAINLPVVIPHSSAGVALLGIMSRDTFIGRAGEGLGISFVGNPLAIAIAMAFVSLPFLVVSAVDAFGLVPVRLEKAALSLGAGAWRVFFTISLPLAIRPIVSGLVLMWTRGLSEFGAVLIVAYHPMVTPVLVFERFNTFGLAHARSVATAFILVTLALLLAVKLFMRFFRAPTQER
ncbi:MAG: hypothetical protein A2583_08690 [Bdellovibrionales bacterium RIFOXYD1_FULL_53_11]|nr:MAG: hypothetical protein A2583_08690 [Bdellovibrionales bacterium RIFOXYD1_FULL_53_11]